jgi:LacI family transcriptional regulator, galactose operon repressor
MDAPKILLQLDISRVCGRELLQGICKYANLFTNWNLIMAQPSYLLSLEDKEGLENHPLREIDAIITETLVSSEVSNFLKIPLIGINLQGIFSDSPNITTNEQKIAELAFDHFRTLGFDKFAYCCFDGLMWSLRRGVYFRKLARKIDCEMSSFLVAHHDGKFISDNVMADIAKWIKKQSYPLALFACNDDCAKLIAKVCKIGKVKVPQEVSILGVDNDEVICSTSFTELSSISLDFKKAGFDTAVQLRELLTNKSKNNTPIIVDPIGIVPRKSTDSSAVKDPVLRKCLQFIHHNINNNIGVPEVIENSSVSRRSVEYKFKKNLGTSIYKQIRKLRIKHISSLLIETDLPIAQISYNLGFPAPEHLSRYFKAETGISPSQFRERHNKG